MGRSVVLGATVVPLLVLGLAAITPDPRLALCGAGATGNTVDVAFSIPSASRIWEYLPHLGVTPELARDDQPAFVVLFKGDARVLTAYQPNVSEYKSYQDVICVLTSDGIPNFYAEVSREGMVHP